LRYRIYNRLYRFAPSSYKGWIKRYLIYSKVSMPAEKFVGIFVFYGIIFGLISLVLYFLGIIASSLVLPVFLVIFILFGILIHSVLIIKTDSRTKFVEDIIPDFLRLLSSNIRSGFTIDKALLLSARPEFGQLETEIKQAAKETISGESAETALKRLVDKFNSNALRRSMDLLAEGLLKGGNLPSLLDSLAEDIRQTKTMRKEVSAIVMMYVIFIFFAAGIGAPLLYSVSGFLVTSMGEITGGMDTENIPGNAPFISFSSTEIDSEFLNLYSILAILITSIFGGMLIGLVQEGSERSGLKFIPILLFLGLGIYFLSKTVLISMFGTMF